MTRRAEAEEEEEEEEEGVYLRSSTWLTMATHRVEMQCHAALRSIEQLDTGLGPERAAAIAIFFQLLPLRGCCLAPQGLGGFGNRRQDLESDIGPGAPKVAAIEIGAEQPGFRTCCVHTATMRTNPCKPCFFKARVAVQVLCNEQARARMSTFRRPDPLNACNSGPWYS